MLATADCASSSVIGRYGPNRDDRIHGRLSHSRIRAVAAEAGRMTAVHRIADKVSFNDPCWIHRRSIWKRSCGTKMNGTMMKTPIARYRPFTVVVDRWSTGSRRRPTSKKAPAARK
jgi:hypothetical protein